MLLSLSSLLLFYSFYLLFYCSCFNAVIVMVIVVNDSNVVRMLSLSLTYGNISFDPSMMASLGKELVAAPDPS